MNTKKVFLFFLLSFIWLSPSYSDQPAPKAPASSVNNKQPALPPMNEEELQKLEQELEAEINALVESLPPEEQKQFYKNLEEVENAISNMSEEELAAFEEEMASFIEDMVPQEMLQQEQEKPEPKETKPESVEVVKEEPKVATKEKPKTIKTIIVSQEKALEIIDAIIKNVEISLQKIQIISDVSGKIEKWGIQRRIKYWEPTLNWNKLKEEIEKFKQQLYTLKEQNPKTKQYKYLPELITDEATYNNLAHVKTTLEEYVPTIDAPAFGLKKLSKPSKAALRNVISSFTEALYKLKLSESLTTIIKKYEPTAKAIKEEGEAAAKKALEETKKPARVEPTKVGGSREYGYNDYGNHGSYDPGTASYGYEPSYTPRYTPSNGKKETTTPSKGTPPSNAKKPAPPKGKSATEGKKDSSLTPPKPPVATKQYEINRIKQALEDLSINLDKISSAFEKNNKIQQLEIHLTTPAQPVDHELILHLTNIKKGFEKVATNIEAINFNMKQLSTRQKEEYIKKVSELFKKHQKALGAITKEVVEINKKWETLKDRISDNKKRDYKLPDLIIQLQEQLQNLDEALQRFSTSKK